MLAKLAEPSVSITITVIFVGLIILGIITYRKYQEKGIAFIDYLIIKIPVVGQLMFYLKYYELFVLLEFFRKAGSIIPGIKIAERTRK